MWLAASLLALLQLVVLVVTQDAQIPLDTRSENDTLFWGPYRPNLYFGVRPRVPNSLLTGLLWSNLDDYQHAQANFRHTCEQHAGMAGYGWEEYDARKGGRQVIHDAGNKIDMIIDFVKIPGGSKGGSWAARVKGVPRSEAPPNMITTVLFQAGIEGIGEINFVNGQENDGIDGPVEIHGSTVELGDFDIEVIEHDDNSKPHKTHPSWDKKPLDVTLAQSVIIPAGQMWRGLEVVFTTFRQVVEGYIKEYGEQNMPPPWQTFTITNDVKPGNFHTIQKMFVGEFQFDIIYKSASSPAISSTTIDKLIPDTSSIFKRSYLQHFQPQEPFTGPDFLACGQSMLSNLVGGIGYFHGDSLVDRSYDPAYEEEDEGFWEPAAEARQRNQPEPDKATSLFTMVPSRPFFPRGFLWDEGFHLIPVVDYDIDLSLQILESWLSLMDSDGWIAREQILGPEARSKVPAEFQVQYPHYANPSTLFLIVERILSRLESSSNTLSNLQQADITSRLAIIYPLLTRHYAWYRRTQLGDIKSYDRETKYLKEGYRWRGRTPRHILPSGLDDYPRPQPPHPGELHLDLLSWIGLMSRSLQGLSTFLLAHSTSSPTTIESTDPAMFQRHLTGIIHNLDTLHYSAADQAYCDATIDAYDEHTLVCHKGYLSLFPFMLQLLPPTHPNMPKILDLISSTSDLWTPYGIRSLSLADSLQGTDENYWRGPIWVNMNYLIVRALHDLANHKDTPSALAKRSAKLYSELRVNLVDNVVRQWKETGFAWEQYNPDDGHGQRTQHFTGWTSLISVIMAMPDLSSGTVKIRDEL